MSMLPVSAITMSQSPCRFCGQSLSRLQRVRGDVCDAMDCRRRATDAHRKAERDAALDAARGRAAEQWETPGLLAAPVVWLADHERRLVPVSAAELDEQREFLLQLGCAPEGPDPLQEGADAASGGVPTAGNRLCALCAGRCCRTGGQQYAYVRGAQVRRWLSRHEGSTWADAVEGYMSLIPAHHVDGSCLHHGERGCTLSREMRGDVCNEYACDSLERVDALARANPEVLVVAGIAGHGELADAAVVSARALRRLPGIGVRD
jgi:hypothetical protein